MAARRLAGVAFEDGPDTVGYALFREGPDFTLLRQFFVVPDRRRKGVGRNALVWLWANAWDGEPSLRLEVLVGNAAGRAFWRSVGFEEYCVALERLY